MFGFESTSDLLIVAIFVQTIAISLIILTIYLKIRKIQYKNIDLNEKIDEKLDRVESKLSYLYNQVLVISANEDKFKYPTSSLDPSTYYPTRVTANEDSDLQSVLKDTTFYGQNSRDSRLAETRLTADATASKTIDSETNSIPVVGTSKFSQPKSDSTIASITMSSFPPNNKSLSEISTSNKPSDDATAKDPTTDFVHSCNGSTSTKSFDHDDYIGKNTNPEIDKIENEILTALKRLGRDDDDHGDLNGYTDRSRDEENIIYPAAKKVDRKLKS